MAAPLSIVASAIAVAELAYDSAKTLHDLFKGIADAPKTIQDIRSDLDEVSTILLSLKTELVRAKQGGLSPELQMFLIEVHPAMQACSGACEVFRTKMEGSHVAFEGRSHEFPATG
jgi:hypothetical protein